MIIHLNGHLVSASEASISPFDRGFLFGDGVYEGLRSFRGKLVGMDRHIDRMRAGLRESRIEWDPVAERITNNEAANQYLEYEYRKPWTL